MGRLTPNERARIVDEYLKGASLQELANRYSVSPSTIRYALTRAGVKIRDVVEALEAKSGGWKKLQKIKPTANTRLVSIPAKYIEALGLSPDSQVYAKIVEVRGNRLLVNLTDIQQEGYKPLLSTVGKAKFLLIPSWALQATGELLYRLSPYEPARKLILIEVKQAEEVDGVEEGFEESP
jgi:DNA-binding CsgD family transcriptional regulator/antitoxin component of MazEF toxin-antitoxin module